MKSSHKIWTGFQGAGHWQAFLTLGELERLTVGLRYYEGYSYQTIAEVLGFDDAEAVNTCLRRARRHLWRILKGTEK